MPSFPFLSDAAKELVSEEAFRDYGETGGVANQSSFGKLSELGSADLFDASINDASMAECCLSGLWLLHNFLDRSHTISQDIASPEGSYWHGIMHRMEGDFGNSKYWGRQVGPHPVFEVLDQQAPDGWSYDDFVDACQDAASLATPDPAVHDMAVAEWVALFEHCGTRAVS